MILSLLLSSLLALAQAAPAPVAQSVPHSVPKSVDEIDLRYLSAGSKLTLKRDIVIPANAHEVAITPPNALLKCTIRMVRSRPYTRVLMGGRELTLTGTDRSALSAKNRISKSTRLQLQSESIDDILCSSATNQADPKVRDFKESTQGLFTLSIPLNAIEVS